MSHAPALARRAAQDEADVDEVSGDAAAAPGPDDRLSAWQLLLAQFDAFLRDPTITRALKGSLGRFTAGVRGVSAALRAAARRLAHAVRHARLPFARRLLLALLALALPLALLALLSSSDDERRPRDAATRQPVPAASDASRPSLPGVGMPELRAAPDEVPRVSVALVVDRTYDRQALRSELQALGAWLAANHAAGTRVSLIDADSARASAALRAADLARAQPQRRRGSTAAAIRSALPRREGRRLLVTLAPAATAPGRARTLRVTTARGAPGAASSTPVRRGRRSRVTIDDRRPNALAASIAREIMAISGQRERR